MTTDADIDAIIAGLNAGMLNLGEYEDEVTFRVDTIREALDALTAERQRAETAERELAFTRQFIHDSDEDGPAVSDGGTEHMHVCVHCGYKAPINTPEEVLQEHVRTCPHHPMRALEDRAETAERERDEARQRAARYAGQIGELTGQIWHTTKLRIPRDPHNPDRVDIEYMAPIHVALLDRYGKRYEDKLDLISLIGAALIEFERIYNGAEPAQPSAPPLPARGDKS
jgi:hypothetical protein